MVKERRHGLAIIGEGKGGGYYLVLQRDKTYDRYMKCIYYMQK